MSTQLEFSAPPPSALRPDPPEDPNITWLTGHLAGLDWAVANDILTAIDRPNTDANRRWLRGLATKSDGKICGGQRGYKLTTEMTHAEYQHFRNWMLSQAREMTARILQTDRVFFSRQPAA